MDAITKVSEITENHIAEWLRIPEPSEDELNTIKTDIMAAKSYILNFTGVSEEELDSIKDFIIVVRILCADYWFNRTLYTENSRANPKANEVVMSILNMHRRNFGTKVVKKEEEVKDEKEPNI